jgi:hypothetical protein
MAYGNHDNGYTGQTQAQASAYWRTKMTLNGGTYFPYDNWIKDLGPFAVACLGSTGDWNQTSAEDATKTNLNLVAAKITAIAPKPVVHVCHYPPKNTLTTPSPTRGAQFDTTVTAGMWWGNTTASDTAFRTALDPLTNLKVLAHGHTHSWIDAPGFSALYNTGSRNVLSLNASAFPYQNATAGNRGQWSDPIMVPILTHVDDTHWEVRYYDAGADLMIGPDETGRVQSFTTS